MNIWTVKENYLHAMYKAKESEIEVYGECKRKERDKCKEERIINLNRKRAKIE